jgi:hypothetical protein
MSITAKAQQLPLYSQYIMNGYLLNPAIAGHDGYTSFNMTARQQWLGFPNAPQTQSFSAQTRVLKRSFILKGRSVSNKRFIPSTNGRVGLGGFIYHMLIIFLSGKINFLSDCRQVYFSSG